MELINVLARVLPGLAARYVRGRANFELAKRYYSAAEASNYRPSRGNGQVSGNANMERAGNRLRGLARFLEENHDLAVGVIDDLVNNVIGAGAAIEPLVKRRNGELHEEFNDALRDALEAWGEFPEVTGELGLESLERIAARTVFRDGEIFIQEVGQRTFRYRTAIPFVMELIEPDLVPFDLNDESRRIVHGVERDRWGAPTGYHILKDHPSSKLYFSGLGIGETKRLAASRIIHLKFSRRIGQVRGVPVLHAAMNRLRDLSDYEESEQIAARVASSIALAINRTSEYTGAVTSNDQRELEMLPGAIYELNPGESMSTVGSDRPNTGLADFRAALMRAISAGTGTRYSSISRDYGGTYSSQRQELVEATINYRALFGYFRNKFYRRWWARFVEQATLSGAIAVPRDADPKTLFRADFRPPALPWIDPLKEAKAWETLIAAKLESRAEISRQRGRDPKKVREELAAESESGLYDAPNPAPATGEAPDPDEPDEDNSDGDRIVDLGVWRG